MHGVVRWFRTPLPVRFWLYAAATVPVAFLELAALLRAVWVLQNVPHPFSRGEVLVGGAYIVVLFVLGAFLVWRAVRAYRSPSRPSQLS